jgi:hypothetical protein
MTKIEMARYLVDLVSIMESQERAGRSRGRTLAEEYDKVYNEFRDLLDKEKENEARTSEREQQRPETRTDSPRRESGRREPDREPRGAG